MKIHTSIVFILLLVINVSGCKKNADSTAPETPVTPNPITETGDVSAWVTAGDQSALFKSQSAIYFSYKVNPSVINIDTTIRYQTIDGFGAALTGSTAYLMKQIMTDAQRAALIKDLFDPNNGIGISYIRVTIGSSDFSLGNYSYCDTPGIDNFAIPATDQRDLIPVLKEILAVAPNLKILATPWSAPAWMKTTSSMNGGSLKSEYFADYATYFVRYIKAMKDAGIPITAITVQNEPLNEQTGMPTMYMSWQDQNTFIKSYLGPLFKKENITTEIQAFDHNWQDYSYPMNILNDAETRQYLAGSAFHAYAGDVSAMSIVHNAYPDKGLYFTEISGGQWGSGFNSDLRWTMQNIFIGSTLNWSKNALMWNLALDQNFGPQNGGCTNCTGVVTINSPGGSVNKTYAYYAIAHMSKLVRPGAVRVALVCNDNSLIQVAFQNTDGSKILVVLNNDRISKTFTAKTAKNGFNFTVPAESVASFRWK
jgi:glucosylceramidase